MNWKAHLKDQERARLESLAAERKALIAEYRRIYDRCRKRAGKQTRKEMVG